jgi:nucleotide-binding universal stress UspA family protein
MFKQIMVPLDGSALAERALPCAAQLAVATGARLHLVRVIEPLPEAINVYGSVTVRDRYLDLQVRAAKYLDTIRAGLGEDGICVQARPRFGIALSTLLQPVLLVRAFGNPVALDHAVVPLDGSPRAEEALRLVECLLGRVIHEVTLLRVIDRPAQGPEAERYLERAAKSLQAPGVRCSPLVERGRAAECIMAIAGRDKLIVMTTRGLGAMLRWVLGSVSDRVARDGAAPVLLVRVGAVPPTDCGESDR